MYTICLHSFKPKQIFTLVSCQHKQTCPPNFTMSPPASSRPDEAGRLNLPIHLRTILKYVKKTQESLS